MATPSWTDAVSVVAVTKAATGSVVRGTLAINNKYGGYLFCRAMRLSASAPSAGLYIAVRRLLKGTPAGGTGSVDIVHSQPLAAIQDTVVAGALTTLNGSPTIPGQAVTLTSATSFAGNQYCGITDSTTSPAVFEVGRTSKISGTTLTFDRNLTNTGILTGATITISALVLPPIWVDGNPNTGDIEVIFDNGLEATVAYAVECWAQTLDVIG